MGEIEIQQRIELEKAQSKCGSCNGMGGVVRDSSGTIVQVMCKGHQGECVLVRGESCTKHIHLCPTKARVYLPFLARAMRDIPIAA
ncbi:MAG: hypothetical protein RLZZ234_850 [Candidatus Parcubacteria bacterium]|jgi:hypothetical protein